MEAEVSQSQLGGPAGVEQPRTSRKSKRSAPTDNLTLIFDMPYEQYSGFRLHQT